MKGSDLVKFRSCGRVICYLWTEPSWFFPLFPVFMLSEANWLSERWLFLGDRQESGVNFLS